MSVSAMRRSRMVKLVATLGLAATVASVGIGGCHDSLPLEPTPIAPPGPSLSVEPTPEQIAAMPPEFQQTAQIIESWIDVGFAWGEAYGYAYMKYLGNYGSITLPLTLLHNGSEVTKTAGFSEQTSLLPAIRTLNAVASLGVTASCSHTVNGSATFKAHNQFLWNKSWLVWGTVSDSKHASKSQPECTCTGTVNLEHPDYDPYASYQDGTDCGSGGDSSGGGGGGSGTQYNPGDNTGGELVSWSTGIGIGGTSACGSDAVVEYICIDVWNVEKQQWEEWSCGYATTCGFVT